MWSRFAPIMHPRDTPHADINRGLRNASGHRAVYFFEFFRTGRGGFPETANPALQNAALTGTPAAVSKRIPSVRAINIA
jgi:hypothetical protein